MIKFKASEYAAYNQKFGYDQYKHLYDLMTEIFDLLPFQDKDFEEDFSFNFSGLDIYIDKKFGSHCEVAGTAWLNIRERIKIHEKKKKDLEQKIIQLKLF